MLYNACDYSHVHVQIACCMHVTACCMLYNACEDYSHVHIQIACYMHVTACYNNYTMHVTIHSHRVHIIIRVHILEVLITLVLVEQDREGRLIPCYISYINDTVSLVRCH